jgi:hypothetical protein
MERATAQVDAFIASLEECFEPGCWIVLNQWGQAFA